MKRQKKKLALKGSSTVDDLKKQIGSVKPSSRPKLKADPLQCSECKFKKPQNAKIRFIRIFPENRIICEVCFENINVSEWEFVN